MILEPRGQRDRDRDRVRPRARPRIRTGAIMRANGESDPSPYTGEVAFVALRATPGVVFSANRMHEPAAESVCPFSRTWVGEQVG